MSAICPACHREVYSRRRKECGYCGAELPAEARFSGEEAGLIETEIREMEVRRRRESEAEEKKRRHAAGFGDRSLGGKSDF